jgi:hypothetical protein
MIATATCLPSMDCCCCLCCVTRCGNAWSMQAVYTALTAAMSLSGRIELNSLLMAVSAQLAAAVSPCLRSLAADSRPHAPAQNT